MQKQDKPESIPRGQPVLTPPKIVGPIPVSEDSIPYATTLQPGSYSAALMKEFDYVEEEYFLFGYANIYGPGIRSKKDNDIVAVEKMKPLGGLVQPEMPYATRVLMVRPRDNIKFSGRVHAYTFHNLNTFVTVEPNLLRNGDAVLGVEGNSGTRYGPLETPSGGMTQLHQYNLKRYRDLHLSYASPLAWPDLTPGRLAEAYKDLDITVMNVSNGVFLQEMSRSYAQAPDIMTQLAHALKSNNPAFPFEGKVKRLFSYGASGGSTFLAPYVSYHHNAGMLPDGRPPFDGYLVAVGRIPDTRPKGAVLVYLESEGDFMSGILMGRDYLPDTDDPPFRIYQIPGTGHFISAPLPGSTLAGDTGEMPDGVLPFDKINKPIVWGIWRNMYEWIGQGVPMPRSPRITRDPNARDGIARDKHSNALGGLRTPWVEVPDATYIGRASKENPLRAGLRPFSDERMKELYGSRERYLQLVNEKIDQMVRDRWVMPEDADLMRLKS